MEIKRYLGFTDGIKEPRKTKVENELSRTYSYNGKIYNAVTFLCVKLLEGCYPEKEENYQYYKHNGELSKPKTLYMYMNPDGKCYFELNKTQYDFVCYLLENGLNTEKSMLAYDKKDTERIEALKQAEQEEKTRQEAKEERKAIGNYFNTFHMYCENDVIERLRRLQEKLAYNELIFKFNGNKYAIFPIDQFDRKPISDYIFSLEELESFAENM